MMNTPPLTMNINGELIDFATPKIMGILNTTPDSFFGDSRVQHVNKLLQKAEQMLNDGADILDIGGQSTRPGAEQVSTQEELERVVPAIEAIRAQFPKAIISIDTFNAQVAKAAVEAGANIINDVSAGDDDPEMFSTVLQLQVPYIIMHKQGTPQKMQTTPNYQDVVQEVVLYLSKKVVELNRLGVNDIIVDPGFGFGKTVEHNYTLLKNLSFFKNLDSPILVGLSRKSMINKVLGTKPEEALNGTTVLNTLALNNGANILRVHDVREAREVVRLWGKAFD